jgi:hypothetical protein
MTLVDVQHFDFIYVYPVRIVAGHIYVHFTALHYTLAENLNNTTKLLLYKYK